MPILVCSIILLELELALVRTLDKLGKANLLPGFLGGFLGVLFMEDIRRFEGVNELDSLVVPAFDISFPRMSTISSLRPFSIHI